MITMTPRQKLEEAAEAIAKRHGYDLAVALHGGRSRAVIAVRFEIYRLAVHHSRGNIAAAARFLEKDKSTVRSAMRKDVCNEQA